MSGTPELLLIDAGNSRLKWTFADAQGRLGETGAFSLSESACNNPPPAWSALSHLRSAWISNVAGAAVASHIDALINACWPQLPRTIIVACAAQCGVTNSYTAPAQLGSDRWASLIGAHSLFPGEHLLIATLGTATTLEALRADGYFAGGLIAPGWTLMMHTLGAHTAQLPTLTDCTAQHVIDTRRTTNRHALFARDTPDAIATGCLTAQIGLLENTWRNLSAAWDAPVRLVLSGGAAASIAPALKVPHTRYDTLVLAGLARIALTPLTNSAIGNK